MKRKWAGLNIDLERLSEAIEKFFESKFFRVIKEKNSETIKIVAVPKQGIHKILEQIRITISGKPEDFELFFEAGDYSHSISRLGNFTTMFGGGILFLHGIRSEEELEKLEKEFWDYMYVAIEFFSKER